MLRPSSSFARSLYIRSKYKIRPRPYNLSPWIVSSVLPQQQTTRSKSILSITVPGYGPRKSNEDKPLRSTAPENKNPKNENLKGSIHNHLNANSRELASKDLSAWMHQLQRGDVKDAVYGSKYLLKLVQDGQVQVGRYDNTDARIAQTRQRSDACTLKLEDLPVKTIVMGLTNKKHLDFDSVREAHKLLDVLMKSIPCYDGENLDEDTQKKHGTKLVNAGQTVIPTYWTFLSIIEGYIKLLDDVARQEERKERASSVRYVQSIWRCVDEVLDQFIEAHYFLTHILQNYGKAFEYRGRRVRNQFQILSNNALKTLYRTACEANRKEALAYANKWMTNLSNFSKQYKVDGPDVNSFTSLIGISGKAYEIEEAEEWFHKMTDDTVGIEPDTLVYNVLMDVYANNLQTTSKYRGNGTRVEGVLDGEAAKAKIEKLFKELQRSDKCKPDSDSYKILIKMLSRVNSTSAASSAEYFAQEFISLQEIGAIDTTELGEKDDYLHNAMIYAWARNESDLAFERAKWWFEKAETSSIATPVTYNTMMHVYSDRAKTDRDACVEVEKLFDQMKHKGIEPSNTTYSTLMTIWSKHKSRESTPKVLHWFDMHHNASKHNPSIKSTTREYNIALMAISKTAEVEKDIERKNHLIQTAREIYKEMKQSNNADIRATTVTYGAMIKIISKSPLSNAWREAKSLLVESIDDTRNDKGMHMDGLRPSGQAFTSVLSAMSTASRKNPQIAIEADGVMELFEEIRPSFRLKMHPQIMQNYLRVLASSNNKVSGLLAEKWMTRYPDIFAYSPSMEKSETLTLQHLYRMAIESWSSFEQHRDEDTYERANAIYIQAPDTVKASPFVLMGLMKVASSSASSDSPLKVKECLDRILALCSTNTEGDVNSEFFEDIGRVQLMTACSNSAGDHFKTATETFEIQKTTGRPLRDNFILRYLFCIKNSLGPGIDRDNLVKETFQIACKHGSVSPQMLRLVHTLLPANDYSMMVPRDIPNEWRANVKASRKAYQDIHANNRRRHG